MLWREFVKLCAFCQLDLAATLRNLNLHLRERQTPFRDEGRLVDLLTSGYPAMAFNRVKGWPVSKLARLKSGAAPLKLIDLLVIFSRNDLQFGELVEAISGSRELLRPFGLSSSEMNSKLVMSDPWIGIFYSILELKEIRGMPADKVAARLALCAISGMNEPEFQNWLSWMIEQGAIREEEGKYLPGTYQWSFSGTVPTLNALQARMGYHLATNRALPPESRQPGAVNFQFLASNAVYLKQMGEEVKALRERLFSLSRECLKKGEADRIVLAETALIEPII